MGCLFTGVAYLHSKNIAHRDLKPANVLLTSNWDIKIADFGLSKPDTTSSGLHTFVGSRPYMAPEVFAVETGDHVTQYSCKADVWSLGVILSEL
ncbi:Pkinase-domain-containing protein, partial [Calocera viscosa TUFC12733]